MTQILRPKLLVAVIFFGSVYSIGFQSLAQTKSAAPKVAAPAPAATPAPAPAAPVRELSVYDLLLQADDLSKKGKISEAMTSYNKMFRGAFAEPVLSIPHIDLWTALWRKLELDYLSSLSTETTYDHIKTFLTKYSEKMTPDEQKALISRLWALTTGPLTKTYSYYFVVIDVVNKLPTYAPLLTSDDYYFELLQQSCDIYRQIRAFSKARTCLDKVGSDIKKVLSSAKLDKSAYSMWKGREHFVELTRALILRDQGKIAEGSKALAKINTDFPTEANPGFATIELAESSGYEGKYDTGRKILADALKANRFTDKKVKAVAQYAYASLTDLTTPSTLTDNMANVDQSIATFYQLQVPFKAVPVWIKARLLYQKNDTMGAIAQIEKAVRDTSKGNLFLQAYFQFDLALYQFVAGNRDKASTAVLEFGKIVKAMSATGAPEDAFFGDQQELLNFLLLPNPNFAMFKKEGQRVSAKYALGHPTFRLLKYVGTTKKQ